MRTIDLIIIHCSAVKPNQTSTVKQIDAWHKAQGWRMIGYHYVVRRDGTVELGRPESEAGAHCTGVNQHSIGICYEGGLDSNGQPADTRTPQQKQSLIALIRELKTRYPLARVAGHRDYSPKPCPCFDARKEYQTLGK